MSNLKMVATEENVHQRTLESLERRAMIISSCSFCPAHLKGRPADVLGIVLMGYELGFHPWQSVRTIGNINGVPFVFGDGLLALVKRSPDFEDIHEWLEGEVELQTLTAYCTVTRRGQKPQTRSFSCKDAVRAGLFGKGVWLKYPQRMLQHRARGYACRDVFPDAIFGLLTEDEAQNISVSTVSPIRPKSKGIEGLKEALGIKKDIEIVESQDVIVLEKGDNDSPELCELKDLMIKFNIRKSSVLTALDKFGVDNLEDLTPEMIEKWTTHLRKKDSKND